MGYIGLLSHNLNSLDWINGLLFAVCALVIRYGVGRLNRVICPPSDGDLTAARR